MKRFRSLFSIAAAAIALSNSASAATLTYTLFVDGAVTGSLNGTAFTATSFSITASGDSSTVQSGLVFTALPAQLNVITAPFVQINTSSGALTTTLLNETPFIWNALTYTDGSSASVYAFVLAESFTNGGSGIGFFTSYYSPDLSTPATYSGSFVGTSLFETTGGTLELSVAAPAPATFNISAVPEPATATSSLLLSLGGLSLVSRRNRKA